MVMKKLLNLDSGTIRSPGADHKKKSRHDIAIIGMGVKMPMAETVDQFWSNIRSGVDCISAFPVLRRKDIDLIYRARGREAEQMSYYEAAYLDEIDKFDYNFFKIAPKEASLMDPAQRLFLETVWQAIEDAGYGGRKICGSKTGIMIGYTPSMINSYAGFIFEFEHSAIQMAAVGNIPAILPSRIAYLLDLKGPTMFLDTACSSSLIAVHLACRSIRCGECDMAVAGGVKLILTPIEDPEEKLGIESADFRTKAFDDRSDGTGLGEGLAVVLLKPLAKALKDKDHIYAVIKGGAANQDGYSASLTAPNPLAHAAAIEAAWRQAGIDPETISYIETHGTGTKIGDPIEVEGISRAFRRHTARNQFCGIGTVKTNIGHLYEASGIAGLIKAALALEHRELPPTLHFNVPNQYIGFAESPIYVNTKLTEWQSGDFPRRCGVNSFGMGGTNCHIVLEEAPPPVATDFPAEAGAFYVFTLSAKQWDGFNGLIAKYGDWFDGNSGYDIAEICYTANTGRGHYNIRLAVIASDFGELQAKLFRFINSGKLPNVAEGIYLGEHTPIGNRNARKANELTDEAKRGLTASSQGKVRQFLKTGKTDYNLADAICELYVRGAEIDWERFYRGRKIKKLRLPTYSFEKTRCWLDITAAKPKYENTGLYYQVVWEPDVFVSLPEDSVNPGPELTGENILLIYDALSAATMNEAAVAYLRHGCNSLIEVELGDEYRKIDDQKYQIRNCEADFDELLTELQNKNLTQVIHSPALGSKNCGDTLNDLTANLHKGLYSLFFLMKSIQKALDGHALKLFILSYCAATVTGTEGVIKPENSSLAALGRIFTRENPLVKCKFIDTDDYFEIGRIYAELQRECDGGQVAYRENQRYFPEFREVDLAGYQSGQPVAIKSDGVYIITGGAGGIGLEIAKYLASKNRVNIALINRSPLPERDKWPEITGCDGWDKTAGRISAIREIETNGSTVCWYSADVSDFTAMEAVFHNLRAKFSQINGIVHAAGAWSDGLIHEKNESAFAQTIRPKIEGTWILANLTQHDNLDFLVLFSSIAAIYGAPGQGDYAAANSYLNAFAAWLRKRGRRGLAINWVTWLETGMAVATNTNIGTAFKGLATKQGIEAFAAVLDSRIDQVVVGEIDYESDLVLLLEKAPLALSAKIKRNFAKKKSSYSVRSKHRPGTTIGEVALTGGDGGGIFTETERKVAQVWGEVLGYPELDIEDSFFELGGDSLQATIMVAKFYKEFNLEISLRELLTTPTIQGLAKYIQGKTEIRGDAAAKMAGAVAEIANRSGETLDDDLIDLAD
jgi:acyl transferase domain-containing protein/acyl carrier protein